MLEFIIGRAGTGKTTYCLDRIEEKLRQSPQGNPLVLLLPDHMTFALERQLAYSLKDVGGFSRAYVLGMSRLAYQILMRCGGAICPHLSEVGKQLLLSRVLSRQKLSILAKAARQQHFTSSVASIIEEFKTANITSAELKTVASVVENETLKQKLTDLSSIYEGLNAQTQGRYHDTEDILSLAIAKLDECTWLKNSEIWIDGFDAFNPQHYLILEKLFKLAKDIHLTICIDNLNAVEHEAQAALFHRQYLIYQQTGKIARKLDIPVKTTVLSENRRHKQKDLAFIEQHLFKFPLQSADYAGGLSLVETANRRLECEAVASDILRLCRDENYRHHEIGILLRAEDEYGNLLETVLADYEIPYFSDTKRQSSHHPLAELIRSSLEAVRTWQYEPLFRAFKTDFFAASRSKIDALENYVLSFGIRGASRWLSENDWQYSRNRQIDSMVPDEEEKQNLAAINNTRRLLTAPLKIFREQVQNAQTVEDYTQALYDFLVQMQVPEKLIQWQTQEETDRALAKEHQQIWNSIIELFDQMVQTCGSDYISAQNYEQLINDGLDSIKISLIPPGYDYVTIAPFEHNTLNNKKAIYILGANEKIIPRRAKTEGLLTDAERLVLASQGLNISGGVSEDNFAERYLLYKGFSLATDYLWVSYALADSEGAGLNKSILITNLHQILPRARFTSIPLETIRQDNILQVTTMRRSLTNFTAALRKLRETGHMDEFWYDVYNYLLKQKNIPLHAAVSGIFAHAPQEVLPPALAARLYTKHKTLKGSVTRFEQFFNCPFKHFAHYALNLQERQEFRFASPDLGILLHAVMHQFGNILAEQNRSWQSVSPHECEQICDKIISTIAPKLQNEILLSTSRYKHLLERIRELSVLSLTRLIEFAKHSQFKPRALEQSFGLGSSMPPLIFSDDDGHRIEITGQIDRIDTADNYYLVIDYKSGNAFINLLQVYYGLRLQLLTYLLVAKNAAAALLNENDAVPAGILYCFLKTPLITSKTKLSGEQLRTEIDKKLKMPGWVLADPEIIKKIDDSLNFIKVRLNKNQDDISALSRSYVKTQEEFDLLLHHIEATLKDAGKRILQGEMAIFPYKTKTETACTYCPYISICRFDRTIAGYAYNELTNTDEEQIMQKLRQKEGISCLGPNSKNEP